MNLRKLMAVTVLVVVLMLSISLVTVLTNKELTMRVDMPSNATVTFDTEGVAECVRFDGQMITLRAVSAGETWVTVEGDQVTEWLQVVCYANGVIMEKITRSYNGWQTIIRLIMAASVMIALAAIYLTADQIKRDFYSFDTPQMISVAAIMSVIMIALLLNVPRADDWSMIAFTNTALSFASTMVMLLLPFNVLFTVLMLTSNVVLLRREGRTWRNMLGSIIGTVLVTLALLLMQFSNFSGHEREGIIHSALINFASFILLWMNAKLIAISLCGWMANHRPPREDKDFVLILGCMVSRKGKCTPLLRGRVDKAVAFCQKQQADTGKKPVLVPCGGQGKNEIVSEAAAMKEYLLENGTPEQDILIEDRSVNTWQNMRNARDLIAERNPDARIAFSTTNYHVFRSGIWARKNGIKAEGMGSRTKWYYWPNAFMREYAALIEDRKLNELVSMLIGAATLGFMTLWQIL